MKHHMKKVIMTIISLTLIMGCAQDQSLKELSNDFEIITCDAITRCPEEGQECYKFKDQETPICWTGNPCTRCNSGNCNIAESYPMQIFCQ